MEQADDAANFEWAPFELDEAERQWADLLGLLSARGFTSARPARILDLGCGDGRTLVPLVKAGHVLVGVDRDSRALEACRKRLADRPAELMRVDFTNPEAAPVPSEGFDAVLCLGRTWMEIVDLSLALSVMKRINNALAPGGYFVLDNIPGELWPLVASGNWVTGLSEDGSTRMVWADDDNVFTVRQGAGVSADTDHLESGDRLYRLWTSGELRLLAAMSGFYSPSVSPAQSLLVFARID